MINFWLALIALASVPLTLVAAKVQIQVSSKDFKKQSEYLGNINGLVEDFYGGHELVSTYSYKERAIKEFSDISTKLKEVSKKGLIASNMLIPISMGLNNVSYILIAVIGCIFAMQGTLLLGDVQAMLQYTKNISSPFKTVATVASSFSSAMAATKRIFEFLDEQDEDPEPENPLVPADNKGSVEFKNVKFGYVPSKLLMNGVNIEVKPGQKVAVVGPTGAGKTTLINLLMRFYEINGGSIEVDGVNTKKMTREELRKRIGMVLQETWLFEGSIMENLKYGSDNVTDEQVIEAAKTTNAESFIRTLEDSYDFKLSTGAENVSQGERQMLTIVRAMATDPEIMILDEATSNVDTHTEVEIQKAMKQLMQGKTSFVIAHRISTIVDSDLILYMEKGDIKEAGTHDELMAKHGKYEALYNSQFE